MRNTVNDTLIHFAADEILLQVKDYPVHQQVVYPCIQQNKRHLYHVTARGYYVVPLLSLTFLYASLHHTWPHFFPHLKKEPGTHFHSWTTGRFLTGSKPPNFDPKGTCTNHSANSNICLPTRNKENTYCAKLLNSVT